MKLRNLTLCLASALCAIASAKPALQELQTVTQPDGTTIEIRKIGNHRLHYVLGADDCLLTESNGFYYFGRLDESTLSVVNTGVRASDPAFRTEAQRKAVSHLSESQLKRAAQKAAAPAVDQSGIGLYADRFPTSGKPKVLILLLEFQDVHFTLENPHEYFNTILNKDGCTDYNATGSAHEYYVDNSYGNFEPQFDIFGPYRLPENMSVYGGNNIYGSDRDAQGMVVDGCYLADDDVDFSQYDNDGDGIVDNIYVYYAGQGEASYGSADSVWPHSYELSSAHRQFVLDNVVINRYACSNEWEDKLPDGIGTFVHEFSHVMGLPDLYSVYTQHYCTPRNWSIMDYGTYNNGGRTPPAYGAYERNALKWLTPELIEGPMECSLTSLITSNKAYLLPTANPHEFYLFEYRAQESWDKHLPYHGMLVWHIDYRQRPFYYNTVNDDRDEMLVEMIKANNVSEVAPGTIGAMARLRGYAWPGTSEKTELSYYTDPAIEPRTGENLGLTIRDITESEDGVLTFSVVSDDNAVEEIESDSAISVEGNMLVLRGCGNYTVYDLSGRKVASGFSEEGKSVSLTLPAGLYICRSDKETRKVVMN